jgi:hypothetical protein
MFSDRRYLLPTNSGAPSLDVSESLVLFDGEPIPYLEGR